MNLLQLSAVKRGGIFAYPTDTVWGFGCNPFNQFAVEKILQLKQRPEHKGLILLVSDWNQIDFLIERLSVEQQQKLQSKQTRPTTWLIPHHGLIPTWVSGKFDSVAVRLCQTRFVTDICTALDSPIVSTSANLAGKATARNRLNVIKQFYHHVDFIAAGDVGINAKSSQIIDLIAQTKIR